jgi:hypothetical protein
MPSVTFTRAGAIALTALVLAFGWNAATHAVDFPIYHHAGAQVLRGDFELYPAGLYDGTDVPSHGFRYAPVFAFLFVPLALLPLQLAAFLFFVAKVAAMVYVARVVARHLGLAGRVTSLVLLALLVVRGYLVEELRYGNYHFLMVALMVFAFDGVERGKTAGPGFALAMAIAAKVTPVLLAGYFALRHRIAACVATLVALVLLLVAPAAVVGWNTNTHLLDGFVKYAVQKTEEGRNHSLRGALVKHLTTTLDDSQYPGVTVADLPPPVVEAIWMALVAAAGLTTVVALRRRPVHRAASGPDVHPSSPAVPLLELSLVLTAMLLASPHTQRQHLTALYVPAVVMLGMLMKDPRQPSRLLLLSTLGITAAVSTFLPLVFGGRRLALAYEAWSPYFAATLVMFVAIVVLVLRLAGLRQALASVQGDGRLPR